MVPLKVKCSRFVLSRLCGECGSAVLQNFHSSSQVVQVVPKYPICWRIFRKEGVLHSRSNPIAELPLPLQPACFCGTIGQWKELLCCWFAFCSCASALRLEPSVKVLYEAFLLVTTTSMRISIFQERNEDYFSQYITEDFHRYISRKRTPNTHGNHVEIQSISEMYNRRIEVYQYDIGKRHYIWFAIPLYSWKNCESNFHGITLIWYNDRTQRGGEKVSVEYAICSCLKVNFDVAVLFRPLYSGILWFQMR